MNFVDLSDHKFIVEPRYYYYGWSASPKVLGRSSAVKALVHARNLLPKGWNFKIWDMQRPRAVQLAMISSFQRRFKVEFPKLCAKDRTDLVFKFAAKPSARVTRVDTHRNGGAVDLTIVDNFEEELYMGTDHDNLSDKAALNYYEKIKRPNSVEKLARDNRRLLSMVLAKAGFENYAPEWWHWSYPK